MDQRAGVDEREDGLLVCGVPGRQARHYLDGIADAARRSGRRVVRVDLRSLVGLRPDPARAAARLATLVRERGIRRSIGYGACGLAEFGAVRGPDGPRPLLPGLGVRHTALWTDHPDWADRGRALQPPLLEALDDPGVRHVVKSDDAAAELGAVAGWRGVAACAMADGPPGEPEAGPAAPRHDIVTICGTLPALPDEITELLARDEVTDGDLIDRLLPRARGAAIGRVAAEGVSPAMLDALTSLIRDWAELAAGPGAGASWWARSDRLADRHGEALGWLRAEPRRWFAAVRGLRELHVSRRPFWLAWLARRADVGVYGCDAGGIGVRQASGAERWVPYDAQASVYRLGRGAINVNQAHDEAGATHKPFQIAAAGVPMLHAAVAGLDRLFVPGVEFEPFAGGADLLAAVERLRSDPDAGRAMGEAGRQRWRADHTWDARLENLLSDASAEPDRLRVESASMVEPTQSPAPAPTPGGTIARAA